MDEKSKRKKCVYMTDAERFMVIQHIGGKPILPSEWMNVRDACGLQHLDRMQVRDFLERAGLFIKNPKKEEGLS